MTETVWARHRRGYTQSKILDILSDHENGIGWDSLAKKLGLSPTACQRAVRQLEADGKIRREKVVTPWLRGRTVDKYRGDRVLIKRVQP